MIDIERVTGHLEDCLKYSKDNNCWVFVRKEMVQAAVDLLREMKPVDTVPLVPLCKWLAHYAVCPARVGYPKTPDENGTMWEKWFRDVFPDYIDSMEEVVGGSHA